MSGVRLILGVLSFSILSGCGQAAEPAKPSPVSISQAELQQFIQGVKASLVFVSGGEFLMGDFGLEYAPERSSYDGDRDSKPMHKVLLSSYSISRFKVKNAEYQFYLKYNGMSLREKGTVNKKKWDDINSVSNTPAHIDWYEADQYCNWLGAVTDLPFALPTEAQWEYSARSRGQFFMVATNDGTYKAEPRSLRTEFYSPKGINISTNGDRAAFGKERGWKTEYYSPLPVDMFPPNALGMYSMSDNGYEWVSDWYDPDYYKYSPLKDPQGPDKPVFKDKLGHFTKVMRGQDVANPYWGGGINVHRTAQAPLGRFAKEGLYLVADKTMRCVVNSPVPVAVR